MTEGTLLAGHVRRAQKEIKMTIVIVVTSPQITADTNLGRNDKTQREYV